MNPQDFSEKSTGDLVNTKHGCCAFVPHKLPKSVRLTKEVIRANEEALLALGELRAIIPSLPNPELLTKPFIRREAILSSKIEGTKTEMEGLYLFETEESGTQMESDEIDDAHEVANYVKALEHGLKRIGTLPVCNRVIQEMHEILLDGVSETRGKYKFPGQFRKVQAYVGGADIKTARYVAPPEEQVVPLMAQLERYINETDDDLPMLAKIAAIHYQFEAVHPFSDGNGRVGRLLISILLSSTGILKEPLLYLSAFFERNKSEYVEHLWQISRNGNWMAWLQFFLSGVSQESSDAVRRALEMLSLREKYRRKLERDQGSALVLCERLFHWPVMTVAMAMKELNMTYAGAQRNIDKLVKLGALGQWMGPSKAKIYLAKEIIKIVS